MAVPILLAGAAIIAAAGWYHERERKKEAQAALRRQTAATTRGIEEAAKNAAQRDAAVLRSLRDLAVSFGDHMEHMVVAEPDVKLMLIYSGINLALLDMANVLARKGRPSQDQEQLRVLAEKFVQAREGSGGWSNSDNDELTSLIDQLVGLRAWEPLQAAMANSWHEMETARLQLPSKIAKIASQLREHEGLIKDGLPPVLRQDEVVKMRHDFERLKNELAKIEVSRRDREIQLIAMTRLVDPSANSETDVRARMLLEHMGSLAKLPASDKEWLDHYSDAHFPAAVAQLTALTGVELRILDSVELPSN